MGSTLSTRLDAKELRELQNSTAFTRDELLELYAQFRFLSDNQKTITRNQFELGLAAVGIGPQAPSPSSISSRQVSHQVHGNTSSGDLGHSPSGEVPMIEFIRAPTEEDLQTLGKVEGLVFRLYDVLYEQAHDTPAPKDPAEDKGLSFDAFCAALSTLVSPRPQEQLEALFRLFDENGDDFITEKELSRALMAINALLELPEISTSNSDSPGQSKVRAVQFAAEVVRTHGTNGQLTLPQFRRAVSTHPVLGDIGKKLVNDAFADFFHASGAGKSPAGKSPAGSVNVSPANPPLQQPGALSKSSGLLSASTNDAQGPRSPGMSRRGSFLTAPADAVAYSFALEKDNQEPVDGAPATATGQPPLHRCSLSHVVVHCYPRETKQQISFVAQRHRAEFHQRRSDRYMHLVLLERGPDALAPAPAEITALHKELTKVVGGGDAGLEGRIHVAVKPVTVKYPKEGIADDDFEEVLMRFLDANPSNVVRLPFGLRGSATAHIAAKFNDLTLLAGHGFHMVTPETAPTASVRRMRNFVFCAERSKASERAARMIGTMMDHKYRDLCVVETLWNVSLSSVGHAVDDSDAQWKKHLRDLRERSLKVAEHFRAKVAHGAAWAQTAAELGIGQSEVVKDDPKAAAAFAKAYDIAHRDVAVAAAEEKEWDASVVKLLQRAGLVRRGAEMRGMAPDPPRSETVFVLGFQSRSMAKKFYAAAMAFLCDSAHGVDAARESVGFIFVN